MSKQREKGTRMETAVTSYLKDFFEDKGDTIGRSALKGSNDEGDIRGMYFRGGRIVIEVKNCRKYEPKEWLRQAERERGNADAAYGVVVFHVNGIGLGNMEEQGVLMSLETFCRLIGGTDAAS